MNKKLWAFLMVLAVVAGMFSGCKSKAEDIETNLDVEIETIGTNDYGWEIPKETIEFSFYQKGQINPDDAATNNYCYSANRDDLSVFSKIFHFRDYYWSRERIVRSV